MGQSRAAGLSSCKVENGVPLQPVSLPTGELYLSPSTSPLIVLLMCLLAVLQPLRECVLKVSPTEHNLTDCHILLPAARLIVHMPRQPCFP